MREQIVEDCHVIVRKNDNENPIKISHGQWDINLKGYLIIPYESIPKLLIKKYDINIPDIYKK